MCVGVCVCVLCVIMSGATAQIHLMSLSGPEHVNYAKVPFHDLKGMLFDLQSVFFTIKNNVCVQSFIK